MLLSLAALTLAATVTLWVGFWRPLGLLEVECAVSAAALVVAMLRRQRIRLPREFPRRAVPIERVTPPLAVMRLKQAQGLQSNPPAPRILDL